MAFTDEELLEIIDNINYSLPVRWKYDNDWYEIKGRDIDQENDTVTLPSTKNDGTVINIVLTKAEACGDAKLVLGALKQKIYDGLA